MALAADPTAVTTGKPFSRAMVVDVDITAPRSLVIPQISEKTIDNSGDIQEQIKIELGPIR